jgi:hypothetical protein
MLRNRLRNRLTGLKDDVDLMVISGDERGLALSASPFDGRVLQACL